MPDAPTPDPAAPSPVAPGAPLELLPGTADLLVLRTLVRGPMHGLAVASRGRRRTAGVLTLGACSGDDGGGDDAAADGGTGDGSAGSGGRKRRSPTGGAA